MSYMLLYEGTEKSRSPSIHIWIRSSRGEARYKFDVSIVSWIPDWGPKLAVILPFEISMLIAYVSYYKTIYQSPHMVLEPYLFIGVGPI